MNATPSTSSSATVRLTVGQALVRFLAHQWSERDGERARLIAGCFGIFGHGNVAGYGQGLLQAHVEAGRGRLRTGLRKGEVGPDELPYILAPQRAGHRAHRGLVRAHQGPHADLGGRRPRSGPARPT